jgi:hypothetical protein
MSASAIRRCICGRQKAKKQSQHLGREHSTDSSQIRKLGRPFRECTEASSVCWVEGRAHSGGARLRRSWSNLMD